MLVGKSFTACESLCRKSTVEEQQIVKVFDWRYHVKCEEADG